MGIISYIHSYICISPLGASWKADDGIPEGNFTMLHGARSSKAILVVPLCKSAVPGKRKVENPWGNPMVAPPTQIQNGHTKWGPRSIAKLVNITPITMVYGTQITIVTGVYKPIYNWGAPHCRNSGFTQLYSMVIWPIVM